MIFAPCHGSAGGSRARPGARARIINAKVDPRAVQVADRQFYRLLEAAGKNIIARAARGQQKLNLNRPPEETAMPGWWPWARSPKGQRRRQSW